MSEPPLIEPFQSHDALLSDIHQASCEADAFHLWWLGQSGFLLKWQDRCFAIDPYLSDSLTRKYAATDKPHVRMTQLCLDPARLGFAELATSSHNHTDHLDAETLVPMLEANPNLRVLVPAANEEFAADRLGVSTDRLVPIDAGETREFEGMRVHAVPAAHESVERDAEGRCKFLGYVFQFGSHCIYHSGDTIRFEGMARILEKWRLDVAMLPINGRAPERRVSGNLWGREAAELAKDVGCRVTIPCHYEMFQFNTASPGEFVATAAKLSVGHRVLRCGERFSSWEIEDGDSAVKTS